MMPVLWANSKGKHKLTCITELALALSLSSLTLVHPYRTKTHTEYIYIKNILLVYLSQDVPVSP